MTGEEFDGRPRIGAAHAGAADCVGDSPDEANALAGEPDAEVFHQAEAEAASDPRPRTTLRRSGMAGQMLGGALLGLRDVLEGRPKEEIPIQVDASGDPPYLDVDGLDEQFDDGRRMVGPPLERIEDLRFLTNQKRRRRSQ